MLVLVVPLQYQRGQNFPNRRLGGWHTNTGISGTSGFAASDLGEEDLQLRVEKSDVLATEDLGDKRSTGTKNVGCDVECRQQELGLNIFVHVVKSSN